MGPGWGPVTFLCTNINAFRDIPILTSIERPYIYIQYTEGTWLLTNQTSVAVVVVVVVVLAACLGARPPRLPARLPYPPCDLRPGHVQYLPTTHTSVILSRASWLP